MAQATKIVGIAKVGRPLFLDPNDWNPTGGDSEPPAVLRVLAHMYPGVEFRLVTRSSPAVAELNYPPNVTQPLLDIELPLMNDVTATNYDLASHAYDLHKRTRHVYEDLDELIVWSGPHGIVQLPIPAMKDRADIARPHQQYLNYASFLMLGINAWRDVDPVGRQETWLCTDPRHYVRPRDLKWPVVHPIVSQYELRRNCKHERYGDTRVPADFDWAGTLENGVWVCPQRYAYTQLEMACLVDPDYGIGPFSDVHDDRRAFGVFINESSASGAAPGAKQASLRKHALRDWILPLDYDPGIAFLHGKWTDKTMAELSIAISPAPWDQYFDLLRSIHCTITTPASGTGWATTKPWESFAAGTVCFFHPAYDDQGHIIPTLAQLERGEVNDPELELLARWLRPFDPDSLKKRVHMLHDDVDTWTWIVRKQRQLFNTAVAEARAYKIMMGELTT